MRFLFCNIAWMDYYKGNINGEDKPQGGGSFVEETGTATEEHNFDPVQIVSEDGLTVEEYCYGFVETKRTKGNTVNQMKIENIVGCELCKNEDSLDGVTVVYCARYPSSDVKETFVVGWYLNATVFRHYKTLEYTILEDEMEYQYTQYFNAFTNKENVVLLPKGARRKRIWQVPRKTAKGLPYGFGQSNVWYANEKGNDSLNDFLKRIEKQINEYSGDNWIDSYPN